MERIPKEIFILTVILYGMTANGGTNDMGVIFKIKQMEQDIPNFSILQVLQTDSSFRQSYF